MKQVKKQTDKSRVGAKPTRRKNAPSGAIIENQISVQARAALAVASRHARAARLSIMDVSNNELTLVAPDGTRTFVKTIPPGVRVKVGKKITLR